VSVFGIEMDDNDEYPSKQSFPIEITVFVLEMDVNYEHSLKQ
jgi:hypothetical protein